jgi:hypothetical protein
VANAVGSVWDGPSAGAAQLTDLTDINGAPLLQLQADAHGYVAAFYGPDGYERLWVDFGGGRVALVSVTVGERFDSHVSGIDPHGDRAYADGQITGAKALTTGVHGVTGKVVGDTDAQTLTNKTLTSPTINAGALSGQFSGNPSFTGLPKLSGAASGTDMLGINVIGDGFDRVRVTTEGKISWGPGNAARDINMYRDGAGFLALSGAALRVYQGATSNPALSTRLNGDVNARGVFGTDGKLSWGDGTNVQDTALYRANPGELKTDTILTVGGELHTNNLVRSNRTNPSDSAFEGRATGDTYARWFVREDGLQFWGPGNASQDTNLYRSAANVLKTDDSFVVAGEVTMQGSNTWTTYTPTVTNGGSVTWATRTGYYWKLGKIVFVTIYLAVTAAGSGTSLVTVDMPSSVDRSTRQALTLHAESIGATGNATSAVRGGECVFFTGGTGGTADRLRVDGSAGTEGNIEGVDLLAGGTITIQGWYREA